MAVNRAVIIKAEKWAIWLSLIAIVFLLRHLFPIFFLTFVLSYIGSTAVNAMTRRFPRRRVNLVIVYLIFLGVLAGGMVLMVPRILGEARNVVRQYITTTNAAGDSPVQEGMLQREAREVVDGVIIGVAGRPAFDDFRQSDAYAAIVAEIDDTLRGALPRIATAVTVFANNAVLFVFNFILSILLSFLMLWDLPRTKERIASFAHGRTAEIYAEIAPGLRAFGIMLGRAFEAQTVVAVVNSVLSAIGFIALGLPSIALLGAIVFVCSYIPILGMVLSTIPAIVLAFKLGGITKVLWLLGMVLVIHAIEAYALNPLIYGRHLHLHPLLVLVVLLVAEHLFGLWGLLLGVPIAAFVLKYVVEGHDVATTKPRK
ncbi:MAG TPA: AI-2E family transporter [Thermoanaerobaculia bacterium]|jgi:predicted PurR-regulated permease PerM